MLIVRQIFSFAQQSQAHDTNTKTPCYHIELLIENIQPKHLIVRMHFSLSEITTTPAAKCIHDPEEKSAFHPIPDVCVIMLDDKELNNPIDNKQTASHLGSPRISRSLLC
jgi:hypothetical protein